MGRKRKGLQPLRDAFAGCFDERLAQGPKSKEERGPLRICLDRQKVMKHFASELHSGDLHHIWKFTHRFYVDANRRTPYRDSHQFFSVADAEVEVFRLSSVIPRIEPGLSAVTPNEGNIPRRTIKELAKKDSCCRAGCGNAPSVLVATQASNF